MQKVCLYLLIISVLGNLVGLVALFKAYDYRKKMILAWAQSHEWASEFQARQPSENSGAAGIDLVLLGASITANWDPSGLFPEHKIVNKGIDGQFASQLLLRFQHDVIDLHPKAVVIKLCEMNFSHDVPLVISRDNVKMMTALARANGIQPIVATVIPVTETADAASGYVINRQIREFNLWLKGYASEFKYALVDLEKALADENGYLRPEYSHDGVHPNEAGHDAMSKALQECLSGEGW
jgi:lysophospholipase L1-like esterase